MGLLTHIHICLEQDNTSCIPVGSGAKELGGWQMEGARELETKPGFFPKWQVEVGGTWDVLSAVATLALLILTSHQ